jgi:hypothetical protein
MTLSSGQASPDSPRLSGDEGILETVSNYGTLGAQGFSDLDRFRSDLSVCNVFREVDAWEAFTGYFPSGVDFQQELGVWVSGVNHKVEPNERNRNALY